MKYPTQYPKQLDASHEITLPIELLDIGIVRRVASVRSHCASRITWHSHDCYEILLLSDGATEYEFRNNHKVNLSGGEFLAIPPGVEHRGVNNVRRPATLTGIMIDLHSMNALKNTPFTPDDLAWISDQFEADEIVPHKMTSELCNLIKTLRRVSSAEPKQVHWIISLRLKLCEIIVEVAKQISVQRIEETRAIVERTIDYMKNNFENPSSIDTIAKCVQCSRARLFEIFKDSTGISPNDYWQRLRIDTAQDLLAKSDKSITEIALQCGFNTSQYFSSVFRKYAGESPSDFRKRNLVQSETS